jgi:putative mRNA 3-end processing factor
MKLQCLGASKEVGRSAFLLKGKDNILFDYGLKLNPTIKDVEGIPSSNTEYPLPIEDYLDGIILSHAHLDHSGAIPSLYKTGNSPLFLTKATLDLSDLLWKDTIKIAKFEKTDPIFDEEDIAQAHNSAFYVDFRKPIKITQNSVLTFYDAGHILGSAISVLEIEGKKIMYTGDFRSSKSALFNGYDKDLPKVDILITETTYGQEDHENREKLEKEFIEKIKETIQNNGSVIIPAFAIERSQELISILYKYKINKIAPIFLDGMSTKATKIFTTYPEYFSNYKDFKKGVRKIEFVKKHKQRKKIVDQQCIIITTAGMLEGGPVFHYIKELGYDPKNRIILTGYQVEGTNGYRLLNTGKLIIDNEEFKPKADVFKTSFSAHADKSEILELIEKVKPKKVICVHGDEDTIFDFKKELESKNKNIDVIAPNLGDEIDL